MIAVGRPFADLRGEFAGYLCSCYDVTEQKHAGSSLRHVSAELLQIQDKERRRIDRELHDSTGQSLIGLLMNFSTLNRYASALPPVAQQTFAESIALIKNCRAEVRTLSHLLHPPLLDELGLGPAIRCYVGGFSQRSGVRVNLDISLATPRMSRAVELVLLRVVQESLTNTHRHSGSPVVDIHLKQSPLEVTLEMKDHGRGIPLDGLREVPNGCIQLGVGITGMRERVRKLGGQLEILSGAEGTTVKVRLPFKAEE